MSKNWLCDSCRFADIKVSTYYKPFYASSSMAKQAKRLVIWCKFNRCIKSKLSINKKCGYKPKAGMIGKHTKQEVLI